MSSSVVAWSAISPLGRGEGAVRVAFEGEAARVVVTRDPALAEAGLARPLAARAALAPDPAIDRATQLLEAALSDLASELDASRPGWRAERLAVVVGTSSGGMLSAERFFAARAKGEATDELARRATYFAPLDDALAAAGLGGAPRTQILAACAASTIAIGLGHRMLSAGVADLVIAGGYDGLGLFVASGFEGLRATSEHGCRPFRVGRDGMSLGEGAALVALARGSAKARFFVRGFGTSNDAVHPTAPDRTGGGLARAALAALAESGLAPSAIGVVSAHATATSFNDPMEHKAMARVFGEGAIPAVHPMKAQIGHTLGAAGVLELLAAVDARARGLIPAAAGDGELDPETPVRLEPVTRAAGPGEGSSVLKLSAAFGGSNAALVLSPDAESPISPPREPTPRALRAVRIAAGVRVTSASLELVERASGTPRDRMGRFDEVCRLGATAVAALAEACGKDALRGAGVVVGHALATLDTNEAFDAKKRAKGPRYVEPRAFPATSPNVVAGECALLFGLTGPGFATGGGLAGGREALAAGALLVALGDCDDVVVLAVDHAGPVAREVLRRTGVTRAFETGAIALLVSATREGAAVDVPVPFDHAAHPIGHLGLVDWLPRS